MERFSFAKNGSAQKSWQFCPSSRVADGGGNGGGYGGPQTGTYERQKYSVSGYVNGYNPSLPAYPPTRAQIEAAAKRGVAGPGAGQGGYGAQRSGYSGEIADQMSTQIRFERARGAGGTAEGDQRMGGGRQTISTLSETSGGLTYSGHGAWDGPAPRGDPSKPAPGTPYYVNTPSEPVFEKSLEQVDVPLGTAGNVVARVPTIGAEASALKDPKVAEAFAAGALKHVRLPSATAPGASEAFALVKALGGAVVNDLFVTGTIAPGETNDPEKAVDAALAAVGKDAFDLLILEWPIVQTFERDWAKLEELVDSKKTKCIGLANASVPVIEAACRSAKKHKPAANVAETHPLMAHRKLVGVCRRYGVVVIGSSVTGNGDSRLMEHAALRKASEGSERSRAALLARWSAQRGVPFLLDLAAGADAVSALDFRLTNAQKVLMDSMEPPPREGGIRFGKKPDGIAFEWDDPFLGGAARPGLDLEKMNLR